MPPRSPSSIYSTEPTSVGIDLTAARALSIPVSGTTASAGVASGSSGTVEQTWALILALARLLLPSHESIISSSGSQPWQVGVAPGLAGKTLGLVGLGRLGSAVAVVGKAFGMDVVAWSPHLTDERAEAQGVGRCDSLEGLLRGSDVVSLHLVLAETTEGIIGGTELGWMKSTAFLVNTSRGPLVDEVALREVLDNGGIAGAGLDVFAEEPLPANDPWRTTKNVVLSPHMGECFDLGLGRQRADQDGQGTSTRPTIAAGGPKRSRTSSSSSRGSQ